LNVDPLLDAVVRWTQTQPSVRAAALVGSHARDAARPDSDVDIVLLAADSEYFRRDSVWLEQIDWESIGASVDHWADADYGGVWSRHVRLTSGLEVELSFGSPSWADTQPVDPGTRDVMTDGHRILYDPDDLLRRLVDAL
jgi:uncharacterized protein